MASTSASSSTISPNRHPRVGLAVFLVDDRGYVLIGKRKGAHGSGTLALPGGHLEWNESFEECAAREVLEETGVEIGSHLGDDEVGTAAGGGPLEGQGVKFLTALNCTGITGGQTTSPDGLHYVTIFMRARVHRKPGEQEVPVKLMEPEKCSGWVWVPLKYLFSNAEAQASLERMEASAQQQGISLGASMEKLLLAQRLGERMRDGQAAGTDGTSAMRGATFAGKADGDRFGPLEDEEYVAYALADDLAQGAVLFRPLTDLCRQQEKLLREELTPTTHASSPSKYRSPVTSPRKSAAAAAPQLPSGILDQDATAVINQALSSPPHLKHTLTLTFPTPTPRHAQHLASILSVDKPLRPNDTSIKYEPRAASLSVELKTSTVRLLRLAGNSLLEDVALVLRTMQAFPGPGGVGAGKRVEGVVLHQQETGEGAAGEQEVFEEGTVGKVERPGA
ncbi:hypothetical protein BCV69DRAFT_284561 [Microstroma glucosiphilum]|uniref:Nudix hydrolase domain-containing protein n=1 Tax=Pseudomicrostroma glucosiphilum TaxID=1684307 RepID=A0A316U0L7_9BASI|nr:hypothetical protein BCV69DRAFT_284561 [Pseudomicrostroma glucosiphilum]PWN18952.1 hypothetical protein BCV69DRAFT_284561 [Pseudomicrostroma glucosiphilum]